MVSRFASLALVLGATIGVHTDSLVDVCQLEMHLGVVGKSASCRPHPERFTDDFFRDSLPELEFLLEEAARRRRAFWAAFSG